MRTVLQHLGALRRSAVLTTLVAILLLGVVTPTIAHHGTFHGHQHNADSGSCCVEVWGHSRCSNNCDILDAAVQKDNVYYFSTCSSSNDKCFQVFSPHRTFSYPVTVFTGHAYEAGAHSDSFVRQVFYP